MQGIFISYRRSDSKGFAGRLASDLGGSFGDDLIFFDIDDIEGGENFVDAIENALDSCSVFLAVIGQSWVNVTDSLGNRRLHNADDFVRLELLSALGRKDVLTIPVLAGGADMPKASDMPTELQPLLLRQALKIRNDSWDYDLSEIVSAVHQSHGISYAQIGDNNTQEISYQGQWQECDVKVCHGCNTEAIAEYGQWAGQCPFCADALDGSVGEKAIMQPSAQIPFSVSRSVSIRKISEMLKNKKFAPSKFKNIALTEELAVPVLIPRWFIRAEVSATYQARIGTTHTTTEEVDVTKNGEETTKEVSTDETRWARVNGNESGQYEFSIDASDSDLHAADAISVSFENKSVKSFHGRNMNENPTVLAPLVSIKDAFEQGKEFVEGRLETTIKSKLSGDKVEITDINSRYKKFAAKLVYTPSWNYLATFSGKHYLLSVDGVTGEASGDTPLSATKVGVVIAISVVSILLIGSILYFFTKDG